MTSTPKEWRATVLSNRSRGEHYRVVTLETDKRFPKTLGGQFCMLSVGREPEILLRRPMAFYDVRSQAKGSKLDILYQATGKGTIALAQCEPGQVLSLLGPIGNSFSVPKKSDLVFAVAGGVGIAPFFLWARSLSKPLRTRVRLLFGFRSRDQKKILSDFHAIGIRPRIAIEGPGGDIRGTAVDLMKETWKKERPTLVLTCGPERMMEAVIRIATAEQIPVEASVEAKMGCGLGVCLSCVTPVGADAGRQGYSLVCQDGPVFRLATQNH